MHHRLVVIMITLISLLVIATILVINTTQREHSYEVNRVATQRLLTQTAASSIANTIALHEAQVQLFADENKQLLSQLLHYPGNDQLFDQLLERLQSHFPKTLQTFSIATRHGNVIVEPFDKQIGDVCKNDIKAFSNNIASHNAYPINPVFIHPQPGAYHYDIMASWRNNEDSGILFVSFIPGAFVSLLDKHEIPGHKLFVTHSEIGNLIEFSSLGYRSQKGVPFKLSAEQRDSIFSTQPVSGALWRMNTVADTQYSDAYIKDLWIEALSIFLVFAVGGLMTLLIIQKVKY